MRRGCILRCEVRTGQLDLAAGIEKGDVVDQTEIENNLNDFEQIYNDNIYLKCLNAVLIKLILNTAKAQRNKFILHFFLAI